MFERRIKKKRGGRTRRKNEDGKRDGEGEKGREKKSGLV